MPALTPRVARIRLYPFKAFDGVDVDEAPLVGRGALRGDRAFAVFDAGGYVNAKRADGIYALRASYAPDLSRATFWHVPSGARIEVGLTDVPHALEAFLSAHLGRDVTIRRDDDGGFPDDMTATGPTIVSVATLAEVASWFPELTVDDVRLRLRTNIEIDGVPAFWEDRLFGAAGELRAFRIGAARLGGTNPCARCIVPSRDARTGVVHPGFQKRVAERRAATLPAWADRSRFDHFYRLTVNTRTIEAAGPIRVGDAVDLA